MSETQRPMNPVVLILLLSAAFFAVFLIVSGVFFLHSGSRTPFLSTGVVGVVELKGVIMDSKRVLAKLEQLEESDRVKAVVLRLNSPGGSVAPSQEIYQAVRNYKKPLVVSMASVAASGAYYIACGAKKVFANPGTLTGSIGVIMPFANLEKLYEWAKVQRYSIKTGKYKDTGSEYRAMTSDEHALLQTVLDDVLLQFKKAVSSGRNLSLEEVTAVADGRILSGQQAKAAHLVDELGTLQDAIDEAGRLGSIKGKPHVVYPDKQHRSVLDFLWEDSPVEDESSHTSVSAQAGLAQIVQWIEGLLRPGTHALSGVEASRVTLSPGLYWLWQ